MAEKKKESNIGTRQQPPSQRSYNLATTHRSSPPSFAFPFPPFFLLAADDSTHDRRPVESASALCGAPRRPRTVPRPGCPAARRPHVSR